MSSKGLKVLALTYNIAQSQGKGAKTLDTWFPIEEKGAPDIVAIGLQEIAPLWLSLLGLATHVLTAYEKAVISALKGQNGSYRTLCKVALGGNGLIVLARDSSAAKAITGVQLGQASFGFLFMSNKGAVGARLLFEADGGERPSITFVTGHLAAHEPKVRRRNRDWRQIVGRLTFADAKKTQQIYDTSCLFVLGDLNYRLDPKKPRTLAPHVIVHKIHTDMDSLVAHDQLIREQSAGRTLHHLNEGQITFKPTYKTLKGQVEGYKTKRVPSWCDRILYATFDDERTKLRRYSAHVQAIAADHKPVSAVFRLPPLTGDSLLLPFQAPYPVDGLRGIKSLIGFTLDRLIGSIWLCVAVLGGGKDKLGLTVALALAGSIVYWHLQLRS